MSNLSLKTILESRVLNVKVIRTNDYWPYLESLAVNGKVAGFLIEFMEILQGFGIFNPAPIIIMPEVIGSHDIVLGRINKYRSNFSENIDKTLAILNSYSDKIVNLLGGQDDIPDRLIRTLSLYDLDVNQFQNLDDFTEWIILNIEVAVKYFGEESYKKMLIVTSEMRMMYDDGTYPPLHVSKDFKINAGKFLGKKIEIYPTPGHNFSSIMFKVGLEDQIDNTFFFVSCNFFKDKNGKLAALITGIQYDFINIGRTDKKEFIVYDEVNYSHLVTGLTPKDETSFRGRLEKSLQKNPAQYFLEICVEQIEKMGTEYIEIINPRENIWLMEHNPDRPLDSILKSGINMYTKIGLDIGGELQPNGRIRITF